MRTVAARLILASAVALSAASQAMGLELARSGKPAATIVVPDNAPEPERFAASELQACVEKISGAKLPIAAKAPQSGAAVFIGQAAVREAGGKVLEAAQLDQLRDDGYAAVVVQDPAALILAGRVPRATLYAVYELLDARFDCGFFVDGDNLPKRADMTVEALSLSASPAFADRTYVVNLSLYGPKRFQATLWNAEDWKAFLRWMVKRKMNRLAIPMTAATRAWGTAFDQAFPEAKAKRAEALSAEGACITARMGYGLHPEHTTALLKEVLAYARKTLGLEVVYVLAYGEFEQALQKAQPNLKWRPAYPPAYPAVAGGSCALSAAEPRCLELQTKLWKAIIETYGTDHLYLVSSVAPPNPVASPGPAEKATAAALEALRAADPAAKALVPTWEQGLWGDTAGEKLEFIEGLPENVTLLYTDSEFGERVLFTTPEYLLTLPTIYGPIHVSKRPFAYGAMWGGGAANDLFENRFGILRNIFRHYEFTPVRPKAIGVWNWNELRRVNPLFDDLMAELAWNATYVWRGEGALTNRAVSRLLERRYGIPAIYPMAEAQKQGMRGAPRAGAEANYRSYASWGALPTPGSTAARIATSLAIATKQAAGASVFYEADLVDLGRNFLHQYIQERCGEVMALVRDAKRAAEGKAYSAQTKSEAQAKLQKAETCILNAHKTLCRIIATRKDMCLDDALVEATGTKGANRLLGQAIREQQSGLFAGGYSLVDSIEYHQQLASRQLRNLLDYAKREVDKPTADPVPAPETFFQFGASDFVTKAEPAPYDKKAEQAPASRILQEFLGSIE